MSNDIKIHNQYLKLNQARAKKVAQGDDTKYIPDQYKKVAQNMESQFAQMMIKEMEQSVDRGDKEESTSDSTYKGWLTTERAKLMTKNSGGLGLQKVILNEIYPQRFRNEASFNHYQKIQDSKFNSIKRNRDSIKNANINEVDNGHNIKIKRSNAISISEENSDE